MAKKKINYTPYILGVGALAAVGFIFKDDIKKLFYIYHNFVNRNLSKGLFDYRFLNKYLNISLNNSFELFRNIYIRNLNIITNKKEIVLLINEIDFFIKKNNIFIYKR